MNATSFIFLFNTFNSTLFVTVPKNVRECYACVDTDNLRNETWPDKWIHMNIKKSVQPRTCYLSLDAWNDQTYIFAKIGYYLKNQTFYEVEDWIPLLPKTTLENVLVSFSFTKTILCLLCTTLLTVIFIICVKIYKTKVKKLCTEKENDV